MTRRGALYRGTLPPRWKRLRLQQVGRMWFLPRLPFCLPVGAVVLLPAFPPQLVALKVGGGPIQVVPVRYV